MKGRPTPSASPAWAGPGGWGASGLQAASSHLPRKIGGFGVWRASVAGTWFLIHAAGGSALGVRVLPSRVSFPEPPGSVLASGSQFLRGHDVPTGI